MKIPELLPSGLWLLFFGFFFFFFSDALIHGLQFVIKV